jgi:hypothetical protein
MYKPDTEKPNESSYVLSDCDDGSTIIFNKDRFAIALKYCSQWTYLKDEWTFWKCTGILFEITPSTSNNAVTGTNGTIVNILDGCIAMALTQQEVDTYNFSEVIESDKSIILDIKSPQRVYFPVRTSDYQMFPATTNVLPTLPYRFSVGFKNFNEIPNATNFPKWIVKITFYITVKDKIL